MGNVIFAVVLSQSRNLFSYLGVGFPLQSLAHELITPIVIGDSMAVDVCSVRHGFTGKLIRFCVSMLGYGFYGDVLKDSEENRWMGPIRYRLSNIIAASVSSIDTGIINVIYHNFHASPQENLNSGQSMMLTQSHTTRLIYTDGVSLCVLLSWDAQKYQILQRMS